MRYLFILLITIIEVFALDAFINPNELKESFKNKNLIILDVDKKSLYEKSHISNAVYTDINKFIDKKSPYLAISSSKIIKKELSLLGLNSNSQVVIYSHNTQKGLLNSSYLALILISHGFENVSILDGGYMAWLFENELLTTSKKSLIKEYGKFLPKKSNIIVSTEYVKKALGKIVILDSRDSEYYYGTKKSKNIKAIGHITSAKSSSYKDKFLKDDTLRSKKELNEIFIDGYEIRKSNEIIIYSDNLLLASMNWYILYQYMGFKNTKIYENSFLEWGNNPKLPTIKFKWE